MGILTPSEEEILLLRNFFDEKCNMLGITCYVYQVKEYADKHFRFSFEHLKYFDSEKMQIIYEDQPSIRTLKGLNWWDDDDDSTPPIAYLPWFVDGHKFIPSIGSIVEIPDPMSEEHDFSMSRFFEVADVNANTYWMINYVVKLVPYRQTVSLSPDVSDSDIIKNKGNFKYLNVREEDKPVCEKCKKPE